MLSSFILISTGENFADVLHRPVFCFDLMDGGDGTALPARNVFILLYWVVLCVAGLVLMVGMFIGVFQDGFIRQRRAPRTQEKLFELLTFDTVGRRPSRKPNPHLDPDHSP